MALEHSTNGRYEASRLFGPFFLCAPRSRHAKNKKSTLFRVACTQGKVLKVPTMWLVKSVSAGHPT